MLTNRRGLLLALMSIFLLPLISAVLVYFHHPAFVNRTTNHGYLVTPGFTLNDLQFTDELGKAIDVHSLQGKWVMMFIEPRDCSAVCENKLYQMRQIRTALNKDSERIERMIVTLNNDSTPAIQKLTAGQYSGTQHAIISKKSLQQLLGADQHLASVMERGGIFLIDPHGNVMMNYVVESSPKFIFEDLQHLLNASQIG